MLVNVQSVLFERLMIDLDYAGKTNPLLPSPADRRTRFL